jgi:hypothetical protein
MPRRSRIQQTSSLEDRLIDAAARLRKEARSVPAGIERESILRKARETETALRIERWLSLGELQPPK